MSLKQLSGETLVYGLSNILPRLLNFVLVTPFITRVLKDGELGQVSNLMFWTALLIAILGFRMDTAVFRFASREEYDSEAVVKRAQQFVGALVILVIGPLLFVSDWVAELINAGDASLYVSLVLITVAFDALSAVPLARLRLRGQAWAFVAINVGNVIINIGLIYFLLYVLPISFPEWYDPTFRVGYYLIAIAVAAGARYFVLLLNGWYRTSTAQALEGQGPPAYGRLVKYSSPLTVVSVAGIVNALVGPTLLIYYDEILADYYSAALRMAVFLNLFVTAYQYAAEPFFFRQAGRDLETADRGIYADALRAYGLVGTLASAGILLLLPWLQFFIGADVRPGLTVLPILLAANFLFGIYSNLSIAYKLTDKTFLGGGIALVGSVFAVGIPLLYLSQFGLFAPAWGMLACFFVMCLLAYWVSRKYFRVDYPVLRILGYVVLAVFFCLLGEWSEHMLWRAFVIVAMLATYFFIERKWLLHTFMGADAGAKKSS